MLSVQALKLILIFILHSNVFFFLLFLFLNIARFSSFEFSFLIKKGAILNIKVKLKDKN